MTAHIALLRKDADGDYGVDFPDFPGCITAGRTLDDARKMAVKAQEFHIDGMIADRKPVPKPSSLGSVMIDSENLDAVAFLVDVASKPARAVRINVMLPEDLLQAIDCTTRNRSRFLADAARLKLLETA